MELYKELAEKCEIEKNSTVYVPDEVLKFFVKLIGYLQNLVGIQ